MVGFQCYSLHKNALGVVLKHIISQQHKRRTDALPPYREHIFHRFIEALGLTVVRQIRNKVVYLI